MFLPSERGRPFRTRIFVLRVGYRRPSCHGFSIQGQKRWFQAPSVVQAGVRVYANANIVRERLLFEAKVQGCGLRQTTSSCELPGARALFFLPFSWPV